MAENEELQEENGKKKKPQKEKKEKKPKKKGKEGDAASEEEEEEKLGSKILLFFIALFIILIWLAIIGLLIKMDVGGFGSSVLSPVLKNVPYVNKILPDSVQNTEEDTQYRYNSVEESVARIKELEAELAELSATNAENEDRISELEEENADLASYKEAQAAFELEKEKFYEEVVFSDEAPDIDEYRAYYESIDPENAEVLYKQVVEQIAHDDELDDYVATFSSMKPKEAASIFDTMTDDLDLVADILMAMDTQSRADILGKMDSDTAAKVAQIMEPKN
jgi:flagellar motility protein MotE (MotC chaperone)